MVYISTDCPDDLLPLTTDLVRFEKPSVETQSPCPRILAHPYNWFIGSKDGCSCAFRHLGKDSVPFGFDDLQDWFPEEPAEVDATRQLYDILKGISDRGFRLSLLDCWSGDEDNEGTTLEVSFSDVSRTQFRLFEGNLFEFKQ